MKDKSVSGLLFIATSFFIGMSAISFQMQLYSLVGIQFSALKLGLPWLIFLPLFLKEKYLFKVKINLRKVDSPLLLFFLLITVFQLSLIFLRFFLHRNAIGWDGISIWYYKANAFFVDKTIDFSIFTNPLLGQEGLTDTYIRSSYPLFLPLYLAFIFLTIGKFSIFFGNIIWILCYLLLLVVLYKFLLRRFNFSFAVLGIFLLVSLPANFDHLAGKYAGYADLILMCFATTGVIFFLEGIFRKKLYYLSISLLLASAAANIKEDGMVFLAAIAIMFTLTSFAKRKFTNLKYLAVPLLIVSPWYVIRDILRFPSLLDASSGVHFDRLATIVVVIFQQFFDVGNFLFLFPLFLLTLVFSYRVVFKQYYVYLLVVIGMVIASYGIIFMLTPLDPVRHINSLADRILYTVSPLMIIFILQTFWNSYIEK